MTNAVIAVSGGIDSAVSLTLVAKAFQPEHVYPVLLPYGVQDMSDASKVCNFNKIPAANIRQIDIAPIVDMLCSVLQVPGDDVVRKGNIMARVRMILLFDTAKQKNALVVGTENKSEYHLGYFTRFGDEASDIEPIAHLLKTQVRQIARELTIPLSIQTREPSAELWEGQTDEKELGFTYEEADAVLTKMHETTRTGATVPGQKAQQVLARVAAQSFKHKTPYRLE